MKALVFFVALIASSLLPGCGSPESVASATPAGAVPIRSVLVRLLESGPDPEFAQLNHESAVVFFNATADRVLSVRLRDTRAALVEAGVGLGFAQPSGVTVTRPALRPGAAAVLAVPAGFAVDYAIQGLEGEAEGRIERSEAP